jgi:hypothetical protein
VDVGAGGELLLEQHGGLGREVLRLELGADQRDAVAVGDAQEHLVHVQPAGDDHRRDAAGEHALEQALAVRTGLVGKVGHLARPEELQTPEGELLEVAGHGERGTVQGLLGDDVVEALGAGEQLHLQHVLEGVEELTDGDGFRAGRGRLVGHGVQILKPSPR